MARAMAAALRRLCVGEPVILAESGARCAVAAVEVAAGWPAERLVLTAERARALGVATDAAVSLPAPLEPALRRALADPTTGLAELAPLTEWRPAEPLERGAIELTKLGALLPAALVGQAPAGNAPALPLAWVERGREVAARSLRAVAETSVGLPSGEPIRCIVFRSSLPWPTHLALLVGRPEEVDAPLVRLHSACFTGDVLGSMRCDCGEQLDLALVRMSEAGAGVLLYLDQEGRGIGLANKLRAYRLQDGGLDTVDANHHLGFAPDERDWLGAAVMLRQLGIDRVRLLTNNPEKLEGLGRHGVTVVERLPHHLPPNRHNQAYLRTKAERRGHLLPLLGRAWRDESRDGSRAPRLAPDQSD